MAESGEVKVKPHLMNQCGPTDMHCQTHLINERTFPPGFQEIPVAWVASGPPTLPPHFLPGPVRPQAFRSQDLPGPQNLNKLLGSLNAILVEEGQLKHRTTGSFMACGLLAARHASKKQFFLAF